MNEWIRKEGITTIIIPNHNLGDAEVIGFLGKPEIVQLELWVIEITNINWDTILSLVNSESRNKLFKLLNQ